MCGDGGGVGRVPGLKTLIGIGMDGVVVLYIYTLFIYGIHLSAGTGGGGREVLNRFTTWREVAAIVNSFVLLLEKTFFIL